jgi:endonuclease/exonuclease/phosphatase family metal-dependent hydrolase
MIEVFETIEKLDFDVLCLQEVTLDLLERLEEFKERLNVEMTLSTDSQNKHIHLYNVILSRLPIVASDNFESPIPYHTFRMRFAIALMSWDGWTPLQEKRTLFADIKTEKGIVRIFSFHATLHGPINRFKELDEVVKRMSSHTPTIIVGDFNIIEAPQLKILNWLLGSPFQQGLPWYSERLLVERLFADHGLKNPLRGRVTHKFSNSQLDHILVSQEFEIKKAWVEKNSHGSDHQPIGAELSLR